MIMKKVRPFLGVRYNQNKLNQLGDVMTPPYDVIYPELQDELYARSNYNFVRLDLAHEEGQGRYESAQHDFQEWLQDKILTQDSKPAFYFHHQTFTLPDGTEVIRKGFFGARLVEDFEEGGVKPHEKTLEGPKADRLMLTKSVQANLSPVFSLYADPNKVIDSYVEVTKKQDAVYDFYTKDGERHQLWQIDDPEICDKVSAYLQDQPVFIADGHHRYETAINYRNECRQKNPDFDGTEAFNYLLMYFSNMNDDGLVILPIHRALHSLSNFQIKEFLGKLEGSFDISRVDSTDQEALLTKLASEGSEAHAFVLLTQDPQESYLLSLSHRKWQESAVCESLPEPMRALDVTVLHLLIFENLLGITQEDQANQKNLIYWKDTAKAINETHKGKCNVTFLMNPTRIEDVEKVALAGLKMPQKSTFFYPKILSGLVIHSLR